MKIHREGFGILGPLLLILGLLVIAMWLWLYTTGLIIGLAIALPLFAFTLRFFRVPNRATNGNPSAVFSPADGKIVAIEEVDENEFLKTRCIQVSVFMSVSNVHVNWYPFSGRVVYKRYHPGKFLVAWHPKSSTENERTTVVLERADGLRVLFRQIAGMVARRIVCYAKEGSDAEQFQQMGFIKFGSRVDVFLPIGSQVKVSLHQKVVGNVTELAAIPLSSGAN